MTWHLSTARSFQHPAPGRRRLPLCFRPWLEILEDRTVPAVLTIDATSAIRTVNDQVLGVNLAYWDSNLGTATTLQMVQDAGLRLFRQPGGSSSDTFHFDAGPRFTGAATVATFNTLTENAGGDGMVTVNYGTGSPQEAAAYLAYCNAAVDDPTMLGVGLEWSDASQSWVPKDWHTAGYWADLRAAAPITPDDGLNYLRVGHAVPYHLRYWEVGNEEYGSWETDHHTPIHDPATYIQFAKAFAALANQIDPTISVGLDVGGTQGNFGSQGGNWAHEILNQCVLQAYVPGFLSDHNYMFNPGYEDDATLLLHTINDPNFTGYGGPESWVGRSQAYRALLQQYLGGAAAGVQLFATEFNSVSSNPSNQTTSLVNGLWLADALGGILETEYNAAIVWDLRNSYDTSHYNPKFYGWRTGGDYGLLGSPNNSYPPPATGAYVPYPTYFAEQLFSRAAHSGDTVVQAASDDPYLSVYAVAQQDGHLALLVINKSPTNDLTGEFTIDGFTPQRRAVVWQYGKVQDNAQSHTTDGHSSLANFKQRLEMTGTSSFDYQFPAYSMTVLDLAPAVTFLAAVGIPTDAAALGVDNIPAPRSSPVSSTSAEGQQWSSWWTGDVAIAGASAVSIENASQAVGAGLVHWHAANTESQGDAEDQIGAGEAADLPAFNVIL
jgi:hypothetical protein